MVPLPRRVVAELGEHLDHYVGRESDALVFTGVRGQPLRRAGFRRNWWLPAGAAAGLDRLRVHDPEHTFISLRWQRA